MTKERENYVFGKYRMVPNTGLDMGSKVYEGRHLEIYKYKRI